MDRWELNQTLFFFKIGNPTHRRYINRRELSPMPCHSLLSRRDTKPNSSFLFFSCRRWWTTLWRAERTAILRESRSTRSATDCPTPHSATRTSSVLSASALASPSMGQSRWPTSGRWMPMRLVRLKRVSKACRFIGFKLRPRHCQSHPLIQGKACVWCIFILGHTLLLLLLSLVLLLLFLLFLVFFGGGGGGGGVFCFVVVLWRKGGLGGEGTTTAELWQLLKVHHLIWLL